jgi:hypothetical protein
VWNQLNIGGGFSFEGVREGGISPPPPALALAILVNQAFLLVRG